MKIAALLAFVCLFLGSFAVTAVQLESLSLGFHIIPSVEPVNGHRVLDLTLSFGGEIRLDPNTSIDLLVMMDSGPTSLGTSAQFNHRITNPLKAGLGITVLWPFSEDLKLQWPILGTYAHASGRTYFYKEFWAEASVSFPLLTLASQLDEWRLLPLASLPTLSLTADLRFADKGSLQPRLTFQPVITDTTVLDRPFGRISDDVLILPMTSVFLRYVEGI